MVGQTCLECRYGPNGLKSCGLPDRMDEWCKDTPQPCGKPRDSAPKYRHDYHRRHDSEVAV